MTSTNDSCTCTLCLDDRKGLRDLFQSETSVLEFLLCAEQSDTNISRGRVNNQRREEIIDKNLQNAKEKFDPDCKVYASHIPGQTVPNFQQEFYKNFPYKCSHFKCSDCGLHKLNDLDQCLLLNNERLQGTITEYKKELQVNSEQKERTSLVKTKKSFKDIFLSSIEA